MNLLNSIDLGTNNSGTPLIVMHGLFGSADNWKTLGKKYSEEFKVHLLDLRNHGRSFHSTDMNFEIMAQDLANFLNHHRYSEAHILGHSLGGKVAMEFAINHSELTKKLIVADIAPIAYPPHHQGIIAALKSVDFKQVNDRNDVDEVLKRYIPEMGVRQFILKNVYRKSTNEYAFRFNLEVLDNNYMNLIGSGIETGSFEGDALFIKGEKSNYVQQRDLVLIEQHFPRFQLATVPKAGHWLHAENPKDFFDLTLNFLTHE